MSRTQHTRKLVVMSMLTAISILLIYLVRFPIIPAVPFLEYDPADIPILIGALAYGPVAGILLTVVCSVIQGITVSAGSGVYGIIMHIIATSTLVVVTSVIYNMRHTQKGAITGLVCGVIAMSFIMLPANHFITPMFMGLPTEAVDALLLPGILPFNLIKAGTNATITFTVYKTVSRHLVHGASWDTPVTSIKKLSEYCSHDSL